jgi:nucleoside-diphosphate-sugar epimerase
MAGISCVINCAAIVSFDPRDRNRMIANNVEGARNLAMALPDKDTWLIQISSIAALGDGPGDDPTFLTDETTPRDSGRRHSGYSVSKFESEQVLLGLGVKTVFLNPGIILGPGQWGKGSSLLFANAWKGMRYYPYGGTGYVDVRDVAAIINEIAVRVSGTAGHDETFFQQRFCLVGANLRYRDFFNLAASEFGKPNPDIFVGRFLTGLAWRADGLRSRLKGTAPVLTRETAESAQRISFYSSGKIRKTLAFEFRPIEETIAWVADCFKKGTH